MSKKYYGCNKQNRHGNSRPMVTITREQYDALVKSQTEINMVRQYLRESSSYTDADNIRIMLGIKKEA